MQTPATQVHNSLLDVRRASEQLSIEEIKDLATQYADKSATSSRNVFKNLFGVCFTTGFIFSAYFGLQSLQSSINTKNGLGLVSLTVLSSCFLLSGFFTPAIIRLIGTKYSLVTSCGVFLVYTLTNYFPEWYTLIPSSIAIGIWFGPTWASMNVHVTTTAIARARAQNENPNHHIALFTGILTLFIQLAQIVGNLASSVILFNSVHANDTANNTNDRERVDDFWTENETTVCTNTDAANIDQLFFYVLLSVYVTFNVVGGVVCLLLIDHKKTDNSFLSCGKMVTMYLAEPLWGILKALVDWRMILLVPMIVLNGAELSFISGRFAEFYVSECVGVQWVGLALVTYGLFSGLAAVISGRIVKYVPEYVVIYTAVAINLACILFLLFWMKSPSYLVVFGFATFWGVADGIWNTMGPGLTGILFSDRQEAGFSANRIWLAAGLVVGFFTADVIDVTQQLWILLVLALLTFISYTVLAKFTREQKNLFACCACRKKTNSDAPANGVIREGEVEVTVTNPSVQDSAEPPSEQLAGVVNKLFNRKFSLDLSVWKSM